MNNEQKIKFCESINPQAEKYECTLNEGSVTVPFPEPGVRYLSILDLEVLAEKKMNAAHFIDVCERNYDVMSTDSWGEYIHTEGEAFIVLERVKSNIGRPESEQHEVKAADEKAKTTNANKAAFRGRISGVHPQTNRVVVRGHRRHHYSLMVGNHFCTHDVRWIHEGFGVRRKILFGTEGDT